MEIKDLKWISLLACAVSRVFFKKYLLIKNPFIKFGLIIENFSIRAGKKCTKYSLLLKYN